MVVFLPASCTNMLLPLDFSILSCVKAKYRKAWKALVQRTVAVLVRK